jgi:hypothetical protein
MYNHDPHVKLLLTLPFSNFCLEITGKAGFSCAIGIPEWRELFFASLLE